MNWLSFTIPRGDGNDTAREQLTKDPGRRYQDTGKPLGAEVFHRRHGDGSHTYFFSSGVSEFASSLLTDAGAIECAEPVGVDRLIRVRLQASSN
jgi:hypothetical protein